jgi:capsular polysaccharide biosynthesis protein
METCSPTSDDSQNPQLSDFSFFGFDDVQSELQRQVNRVEIRGGTPEFSVIDDYIYVPVDRATFQRRDRESLTREPSANETETIAPALTIDEDVVYLGWLFSHYGHFLMQSLARVWHLADLDPSVNVIFHAANPEQSRPTSWAQRILAAFGIPPERILTLDQPARIRRLIVPEPLFAPRSVADDHTVRVHEAMAEPYRNLAARIAGDSRPSPQPLYLSRRRLPSSQRLIIGEAQLEDLLRQQGFRITYPETMPFEEQVRLINSHTDIFSNAGSAAQNVLFALHAPRLHLLTSGAQFSPDYFMHKTLVGSPTTFINGLNTGGRANFPKARKVTPHLVDMPTCIAYLDQHGFMTDSPAVDPDSEVGLRDEYGEAWLYGYIRAASRNSELPADIEREALQLASRSWPLSIVLARYFIRHHPDRIDPLGLQFAGLAGAEADPERLRRYTRDVLEMAPHVVRRASPRTAQVMQEVLADHFQPA